MKSPRTIQAEGLARFIARAGVTATLPDGSTVRGLMVAVDNEPDQALFQGGRNVKSSEHYTFYTLTALTEGLDKLAIGGERWTVAHVHAQYADSGVAWYEANLIGRGLAA